MNIFAFWLRQYIISTDKLAITWYRGVFLFIKFTQSHKDGHILLDLNSFQVIINEVDNPWTISSIYEFQYFNCPTCVFKDHSKQEFLNHAIEFHPQSVDNLRFIKDGSLNDVDCPWIFKGDEIDEFKKEEPFDDYEDIPLAKRLTSKLVTVIPLR